MSDTAVARAVLRVEPTPAVRIAGAAARLAALLRTVITVGAADERLLFLETFAVDETVASPDDALCRLAAAFRLSDLELDLLVLAALPDEHEGFCHVLRSLHPRGESRPTVALALQLHATAAGAERHPARLPILRALLDGPLARHGCITLNGDVPVPERSIVIASRLWPLVQGIDTWPEGLEPLSTAEAGDAGPVWTDATGAAHALSILRRRSRVTILVTADDEDAALWYGVALAREAGVGTAAFDWPAKSPTSVALLEVHAAARDVVPVLRLRVADDGPGAAVSPLPDPVGPSILCMRAGTAPVRGPRPVHVVAVDRLRPMARQQVWRAVLPELAADAASLASRYALEPPLAREVATDVRSRAAISGERAEVRHVAESVRVRTAVPIASGVTLVRPVAGWRDLVLKPPRIEQLRDAVARLAHQPKVLDQWQFLGHRPGSRGVRLMLLGPPGTGKTLSAEVLASALGVDLIVADVSRLVSKWIGETPKNLGRIFDMAERSTAVILFDEADALFGKRTEVSDAHDRYANLETAYLLSRLERFEGLAILASNLRQNIDPAFLRRLEFIVEFEEPGPSEREALWRCHVPEGAPLAADVNFAELATAYRVTGALIRNTAAAAAFLAAAEGGAIARRHFMRAMRREDEKTGKAFPGEMRG